jgi:hypothetical protein
VWVLQFSWDYFFLCGEGDFLGGETEFALVVTPFMAFLFSKE